MKKLLLFLLFIPVCAAALSDWQQNPAELEMGKLRQSAEKKTFKQVKGEVKAGFTESVSDLADLYYEGIGTKKNYKKAYKYYAQAARQGDEYAAYSQAFMLLYGQGVRAYPAQALEMFQEQAQNGSALAALELFRAYKKGIGGEKNPDKARSWLEKAANYRQPTALLHLGIETIEENPEEGFVLLKQAADLENGRAQYLTALCYLEGKGVPQNPRQAFDYMLRSAKQHFAPAQWEIAQWYEQGLGTEKSRYQAFRWTRLAAQNQVPAAQEHLAHLYEKGLGTPANPKLAKKWKKEAQKTAKKESRPYGNH